MVSTEIRDWTLAKDVSEMIEIAAICVITIGIVVAFVTAIRLAVRRSPEDALDGFKRQLSRGLLIGLDLLIAADVIRTVTLEPTLVNVAALGLLVVVRTFLVWSLVLETENRWPWQSAATERPAA